MSPHSKPSNYIRNAHKWCAVRGKPGSARHEDTPAIDLALKGIRTHMQTDKREMEQNHHTHPQTRNVDPHHTPVTTLTFVF